MRRAAEPQAKIQKHVGMKYDQLLILEVFYYQIQNRSRAFANCLCNCGQYKEYRLDGILNGDYKTCGCGKESELQVGDVVNDLTILEIYSHKNKRRCVCRCKCGEIVRANAQDILRGKTRSCGCYKAERLRRRVAKYSYNTIQYQKEYRLWHDMMRRCYDIKFRHYKNYGGRGIKVYQPWHDFDVFCHYLLSLEGYDSTLTLDRIDNDGDYYPGNLRFVNFQIQAYNKRTTVLVAYEGINETLLYWSRKTGLAPGTLYSRLFTYHWPIKEALTLPKRSTYNGRKSKRNSMV